MKVQQNYNSKIIESASKIEEENIKNLNKLLIQIASTKFEGDKTIVKEFKTKLRSIYNRQFINEESIEAIKKYLDDKDIVADLKQLKYKDKLIEAVGQFRFSQPVRNSGRSTGR